MPADGRDVDPFDVLSVNPDASFAEIRAAYHHKAMETHPDRNAAPDAGAQFQRVCEAFRILSDPDAREQASRAFAPRRGEREDFDDMFSAFITDIEKDRREALDRLRRRHCRRGDDFFVRLEVSLEEAFAGARRRLDRSVLPEHVGRDIDVDVPVSVVSGHSVDIKCLGHQSEHGGEPGDIIVCFEVREHAVFRRDGTFLERDIEIDPVEAMCGATKAFAGIDAAPLRVTIPSGTQPGACLVVPGAGFHGERGRGDMRVHVRVRIPDLGRAHASDVERLRAALVACSPRR